MSNAKISCFAVLFTLLFYFFIFSFLLYRGKEEIHSEIELIIYQLKWCSLTSIISLALLVLHLKLVLLLTDVLSELSVSVSLFASTSAYLRNRASFILLWHQRSCGMSHYPTIFKFMSHLRLSAEDCWTPFSKFSFIIEKCNLTIGFDDRF